MEQNPTSEQHEYQPQSVAPQPSPVPVQPVAHPGRTMSIVGLVFAFVFLAPIGLVLSIIGLIKARKAKQGNVVAILGIIFNALGIIGMAITAFIIWFAVSAYGHAQRGSENLKRQADASSIADAAQVYASYNNGRYPRSDAGGFYTDVTTLEDQPVDIDHSTTDHLSSDSPSASNPYIYHIDYCGGDDSQTATGLSVEYWTTATESVQAETTGRGCNDTGSSDTTY